MHESPPVLPHVTECSPSLLLFWASCASSLADMVEALALGADVNWANPEDQSRTPLMQAVQGVSAKPYLPAVNITVSAVSKFNIYIFFVCARIRPCVLRVHYCPVSSCCKTLLMWISRMLEEEEHCTTLPCWDIPGTHTHSLALIGHTVLTFLILT